MGPALWAVLKKYEYGLYIASVLELFSSVIIWVVSNNPPGPQTTRDLES